MKQYSVLPRQGDTFVVVYGEELILKEEFATREDADTYAHLLNKRAIVCAHLTRKALDRDGQGRRYGWSDTDIDSLLEELGVI